MNIFLAVILGVFFGFALYYVGATKNTTILKMLRLEDLTLAKVILFAIGFASFLLSLSGLLGIFDISHLSVKGMNLGVIVGGIIFGIGFGTIGICPGTCVGAIGGLSELKKVVTTIIGGLFGAFVYSLVYGRINDTGFFDILNYGKITLFKISEEYPSIFNIGFSGLLVVSILFMAGAYFMPSIIYKNIQ